MPTEKGTRYRFSGHERILHRTSADKGLPELMDWCGYRRAYIVCSRTLNTRTDVIQRLAAALGERCVGITDAVGEHSPLSNVLAAAREANALNADVIVSVGGGSVMDMCKAMQLCITEQVFDREQPSPAANEAVGRWNGSDCCHAHVAPCQGDSRTDDPRYLRVDASKYANRRTNPPEGTVSNDGRLSTRNCV
jgi:alcohol dehydrogenase class IV